MTALLKAKYFVTETDFIDIVITKICGVKVQSIFLFRLKTFLGEKIAIQNVDLQTLLFPVFVHIYIEMLSNGHKAPGKL